MRTDSSSSQAPERVAIAIQLLRILTVFGVAVAVTDYLAGNYIVAGASLAIVIAAPIVLSLGRRKRFARLPLQFCIWLLFGMFVLGSFTQAAFHPEKSVWTTLFPFAYFYLTGLRQGITLSITSLLISVLAYFLSPTLLDQPAQVSLYSYAQSLGAFVLSAILAFFYERIRHAQAERLENFAYYAPLTGLLNRRGFAPLANSVLQQAMRFQQPFAIMLIDLDDFKRVNDRQGHGVGDQLLKDVATVLGRHTRKADLVARWGGEEFIVLLAQSSQESSKTVAEKICAAIATHPFSAGPITASLGVAMHAPDESLETTIKQADDAMYRAKQHGKNRVEIDPLPDGN